MPVSFDLFGTLVTVDRSESPAAAIAKALDSRGVSVPDAWERRYREQHIELEEGQEIALPDHVTAALASEDIDVAGPVVKEAVKAAFEPDVCRRNDAEAVLAAVSTHHQVALCSNCAIPGLVEQTLAASGLGTDHFDAIVSSVDCGWRKPSPRIFAAVAEQLGCAVDELIHVGDDPRTDGGIEAVGGRALLLNEKRLGQIPELIGDA